MDWPANSAWRTRAGQVRANRWAALQRGDLRALNGTRPGFAASVASGGGASALAVTGTFVVPVILIQFKGVDAAYPAADFQNVLFGNPPPLGRPYSLKTYYEQISNGRIAMQGRVFDPVRVDSSNTYYENNCNGIGVVNDCVDGGRRFGGMLLAVLDSVSTGVGADTVWSAFDNDGPDGLPNSGDDDGDVDFVTFVQPVRDGACGGTGIWAHRYVIAGWNSSSKYVTRTPRRNSQGQPIAGQFITVNNYTMQSQVGGGSGCDASQIMPVGTVSHETGHAFGLPDLYDTDRASGTEGIGEWGIMGSGNYSKAYSPTGYDAWSLNELGWVTIDTLGASRTITTAARQLSDTVFLARLSSPNELMLIENRQAVESDTAALNPTTPPPPQGQICRSNCRKAPGLLLWHIDLLKVSQGRFSNRVNTTSRQGVALEQADGLNNLRSNSGSTRNRGDEGDAYPGSTGNTRWNLSSIPVARTNDGDYAGFIVDQIQQLANGAMRFRFLRREPSVVRAALPGANIRVANQASTRFEDVIPPGDQFTISADSAQDLGRTRARFLAWSIGGPRTRVVVSGAKPDTITATFAAEHRLTVTTGGGGQGTISINRAGDPLAGIFIPEGTPVTLTATPAAGSIFVGWRGDTTVATAGLTLPMGRPYDIDAGFLVEVQIPVADATTEILGGSKLTSDQKVFLDQLGNRNGLYDVGDFLALLRRNGQPVSPELLKQLAAVRKREKGN